MSNIASTTANTWVGTTSTTWNGVPCGIHGWNPCTCNVMGGLPQSAVCSSCGNSYFVGNFHTCPSALQGAAAQAYCGVCLQTYNVNYNHLCSGGYGGTLYNTYVGTTTWTLPGYPVPGYPAFKEVKEITTDSELTYEWNGGSFDMKLPQKFSDCFLKVGYTWSPLYPLIFSALENDAKEISFHLVTGIADKTFEGDFVLLRAVLTTKIQDNLTLMQMTERAKSYLKINDKTSPSL